MKIKQLKLQNFRGINNLTIDFDPDDPTVFIGINGVGKSSILDCIAILFSWFTNRLQNPESDGLFFQEEDISNDESETRNQIIITINGKEINWLLTGVRKGRQRTTDNNFNDLNRLIGEIHREMISPKYSLPIVLYYRTNRAVIKIPLRASNANLFEQINVYDKCLKEIDFRQFFEWFKEREDLENESRLNENPDFRDYQLEAVRQAITQIMEGFENLRVRRSPLKMVLQKQGKELIINQLSDGEKCLLAMIGDIARRLAIANPDSYPLNGKGIILIDEIELHLHPKWQRKIIPSLRKTFPNCQFIITTHSPQVVSHVDWVYLLELNQDEITGEKIISYGKDSNRILETLMDISERPQEIKEKINEIFKLIEIGNIEEAKELRNQLNDIMVEEDPVLLKADVLIKRQEIIQK